MEKLPAAAIKVARALQSIHATTAQDVAQALMQREGNVVMARARLESLGRLISDVKQLLAQE